MAARRLIAVLVVLFAISIAAAAIAPDRRGAPGTDDEATSATPTDPPATAGQGKVTATLMSDREDPGTVRAAVGEQVELTVTSRELTEVQIPDLGLSDVAVPAAPARFDLLLRDDSDLKLTDAEGTLIGRLLVDGDEPAASGGASNPPGKAGGEGPGGG